MTFAVRSLKSRWPFVADSETQTGPSVSPKCSPSVSSFAVGEMIVSGAGSSRMILKVLAGPAAEGGVCALAAAANRTTAMQHRAGSFIGLAPLWNGAGAPPPSRPDGPAEAGHYGLMSRPRIHGPRVDRAAGAEAERKAILSHAVYSTAL